ncbi:response regulator [Mucilaginibacter myungsuensis]|uniref:Response regulator n=1 Tax=Mucilaginibacter myungsuensis TaxID=649104 RepID=A0A929KSK9_9SPHI|nr:response regulator [Mucilaginibacter myungsuensis]MBE9660761.1 response regulator [Mucilaginibacter myungsuensis]MDN3600806.1 response regulator [Mucilaginibacter myungsuensis]
MNTKHLLVIEDDQDIKDILETILTMEGHTVTTISETPNIIQTVLETKPDLIITDYILQGINGGEYCSQIKQHPETAHIPVIILSAYDKVLGSLGHYKADLIIHKPFDNDNLCQNVAELLT